MTDDDRGGRQGDGDPWSRSGWIALLTRPDTHLDATAVEAQYRELIDLVRPTVPVGVAVESISPTTGESRQAGLLVSSPDLAALSRWIVGEGAARAVRLLNESSPTPVTFVTQGIAPPTEFPVSFVATYTRLSRMLLK